MDASKRIDNHVTDWQILGELELRIDIRPNDAIRDWLADILSPLNLSTEFFKKFLKSAQASIMHAIATFGSLPPVQVHISILVLQKHCSAGKSWGFFQLERIDPKADNVDAQNYVIDYYLYVEGD